jgi:ribosomal protein S6
VKRYEGLFILNNAAKEEGIKDTIDKISAEIAAVGGKIETTQKMDRKHFARVANKRFSSGFYVNIIFESQPGGIAQLRSRLALNEEVFRSLFTVAPPPVAEKK